MSVHAFLGTDPAIIQVTVRSVMLDVRGLLDDDVFGEHSLGGRVLILKVFY